MKKFLCYDTNDAASGKINVSANGVLKPNATVPSTNSTPYQQLVTDGEGGVKWEDRLAYSNSRVVVNRNNNSQWVRVFDEVPSFVFDGASVKIWLSRGDTLSTSVEGLGNGLLLTEADVIITLSDNVDLVIDIDTGLKYVFPKKGVYFGKGANFYVTGFSSADSDTPEITWDGNIEFTKAIDQKYIPSELNEIILSSSTSGSSKKFKITVDDSGTISSTEVQLK